MSSCLRNITLKQCQVYFEPHWYRVQNKTKKKEKKQKTTTKNKIQNKNKQTY